MHHFDPGMLLTACRLLGALHIDVMFRCARDVQAMAFKDVDYVVVLMYKAIDSGLATLNVELYLLA